MLSSREPKMGAPKYRDGVQSYFLIMILSEKKCRIISEAEWINADDTIILKLVIIAAVARMGSD